MPRTRGSLDRRRRGKAGPEPPPVDGARWVRLTQGRWALVDAECFDEINRYNWHLNNSGYASRRVTRADGHRVLVTMHGLVCPAGPGLEVDHINRDRLDNRRSNLRAVTHACNMANAPTVGRKGRGVRKIHNRWYARVCARGVTKYLGGFSSEEEALAAYAAEKRAILTRLF